MRRALHFRNAEENVKQTLLQSLAVVGRYVKFGFARTLAIVSGISMTFGIFGGCRLVVANRLLDEMEASRRAYVECVQKYPVSSESCEKEKRTFEANLAAYQAVRQQ